MRWVFLCYLIINPLSYWVGVDLRPVQEYVFQISSLILIAVSMFFPAKKVKRDNLNISIGIFFLWFIVIYLISKTGWSILLNTFLGLSVYLTAIRALDREDIPFLFKGCIGVMIFALIHLLCQYLGYDPRGQYLRDVGGGSVPKCSFFGIRAIMGIYFALVTPMLISISWINDFRWGKWYKNILLTILVLLTIILYFIPVGLSISTGAYLGAILGVLFFLWYKRRELFWITLIPIIIGGIVFLVKFDNPMGMQKSRLHMWSLVIQDAHKKPVGWGLNSFYIESKEGQPRYYKYGFNDTTVRGMKKGKEILIQASPSSDEIEKIRKWTKGGERGFLNPWDDPHNFYVRLFYETGYLGILSLFAILFFMGRRFIRSDYNKWAISSAACIVSLLCTNLTQFPFFVARIGHLVPIILGIFYIATNIMENKVNVN